MGGYRKRGSWAIAAAGLAVAAFATAAAFLWQRFDRFPHRVYSDKAVVVSVGDILLDDAASKILAAKGLDYPFKHIGRLLDGADVVMGNLEGPITGHLVPAAVDKAYRYKQPPAVARVLRDKGFAVLALGNNHSLDYGVSGLDDTLRHLQEVGIHAIGAGPDESSARRGIVLDIKGTRIGLLSYLEPYGAYEDNEWFAQGNHPGVAKLDIHTARADIARLKKLADVVIVHAHFGRNYEPPTDYQREVSRQLIDAGADAVNGHHAHIAHGVEIYSGKPIIYSLGNFAFGTRGRFGKDDAGYGLVASYVLAGGRLEAVEFNFISVNNRQVNFRPRLVGARKSKLVWADLNIGLASEPEWRGSTAIVRLPAT